MWGREQRMMTSEREEEAEEAAKMNFVVVEEAEGRAPACIVMVHHRVDRDIARIVAAEEVEGAETLDTMLVVADIGDCLHTAIHHHTGDWKEDYFATMVVVVGLVAEENVAVL